MVMFKKLNLNKKESKDIQSIEESGATYENVGKDVPKYSWDSSSVGKGTKCLVVRKLTQSLIDSDQFSCCSSWNQRKLLMIIDMKNTTLFQRV